MALNPLGTTGLEVSPIGFGAFKIGRNQKTKYTEHYELPEPPQVDALLNTILEAGINLFDTAPAYGVSEERIGSFLRDSGRRERVVLATKVGEQFDERGSRWAFDRASVDASIDQSLHRLGTDHLDIVNVHSDGNDLEIIERTDVLETLAMRRERGDVGVIGFSGKTLEGHRRAIDHPVGIRVLMIELNLEETSQMPILDAAADRGVGVLIKKGLASGRADAEASLAWLLGHEAISSVVIGSNSAAHMCQNLALARAMR